MTVPASLEDRLARLEQEHAEVEARLADPAVIADQRRYAELARHYGDLGSLRDAHRALLAATRDVEEARELASEAEGEERGLWREELVAAEAEVARLSEALRLLLLPKDPNDGRAVIVEIRGAEGGEEANLWARDLFEMYRAFASRRGWATEVLTAARSDLGGYGEVVFRVEGDDAWTHLKHEGGPHRVQRVPATESQGRVHTSSATVTVLPEADEVEVSIDPGDLRIDVFRSSGPGGQSVNTTDSAVRVTHLPTGMVVSMQDEKSQIQNRAKALSVLRSKLHQLEEERRTAELSAERRGQIGGGGRSEKIRTYNFKENRVSDHRIGLTVYRLDRVLAGELDEISDALVADERRRQLEAADT